MLDSLIDRSSDHQSKSHVEYIIQDQCARFSFSSFFFALSKPPDVSKNASDLSLGGNMTSCSAPPITIFTSISNIYSALIQAAPSLEIIELNDEALSGYGGTVEFDATRLAPTTIESLEKAEILITEPFVLAELLKYNIPLTNLKWCQSTYAGVDPLFPLADIPSFALTRFAGKFGPPIAEWCLARIISHERNFEKSGKDQKTKRWAGSTEVLHYRYLSDLTLTILGCGDIGMCIAKAAKAFGMRVVGYVRSDRELQNFDECSTCLEATMQKADYLVSVLPSTSNTHGLLNLERLRCASKENGGKCPVLLNVGRGNVTDTMSLIQALEDGCLSAAILDVFDQEPLSQDSPLWAHPKVTVSPHVSGLTRGRDVPKLVLDNYERYVNQEPLLYTVDWNKMY